MAVCQLPNICRHLEATRNDAEWVEQPDPMRKEILRRFQAVAPTSYVARYYVAKSSGDHLIRVATRAQSKKYKCSDHEIITIK